MMQVFAMFSFTPSGWIHSSPGALLVVIVGLLIRRFTPAEPVEGPIDSIAILPFRNETGGLIDPLFVYLRIPRSTT